MNKFRPETDQCYVKIICNRLDDMRVLGYHLLAPNAGEITQGMAVAIKCGLTKQQRSILNLGMLAGLNRPHEFKLHFKGALTNGLSLVELREILIQISVYCGVPAALDAFNIAREICETEGLDIANMDGNKE